jgi:small subunit ribosomal protein S5
LAQRNFRRNDRDREVKRFNAEAWEPTTQLGKDVKEHKVTTISQIFHDGRSIQETEIIDALLPELKNEIIEIMSVQRMTKNNRKMKFRAIAVVGDGNGHIGVGAGKDAEVKAAIDSSVIDAKSKVIPIIMGCGSWQCTCGTKHSLPFKTRGRCGSVEVLLKPAPRGLGIVASGPIRKALMLAGVKDVWVFSKGRTRSRYNSVMAVYRALSNINTMKNLSQELTK